MRAKLASPSDVAGVWEKPNDYYLCRVFENGDGVKDYAWRSLFVEGSWRVFHVDELIFERVVEDA